jgi:hypothetical protein
MKYKLTVIFRNDTPSYRTVVFDLTEEQDRLVQPREVGASGYKKFYEDISRTILEKKEETP